MVGRGDVGVTTCVDTTRDVDSVRSVDTAGIFSHFRGKELELTEPVGLCRDGICENLGASRR